MLRIARNTMADGDEWVSVFLNDTNSEISQFHFAQDDPNTEHNIRQIQELAYFLNGADSDPSLLGLRQAD